MGDETPLGILRGDDKDPSTRTCFGECGDGILSTLRPPNIPLDVLQRGEFGNDPPKVRRGDPRERALGSDSLTCSAKAVSEVDVETIRPVNMLTGELT